MFPSQKKILLWSLWDGISSTTVWKRTIARYASVKHIAGCSRVQPVVEVFTQVAFYSAKFALHKLRTKTSFACLANCKRKRMPALPQTPFRIDSSALTKSSFQWDAKGCRLSNSTFWLRLAKTSFQRSTCQSSNDFSKSLKERSKSNSSCIT